MGTMARPNLNVACFVNIQPMTIQPAISRLYRAGGTDHGHMASGLIMANEM